MADLAHKRIQAISLVARLAGLGLEILLFGGLVWVRGGTFGGWAIGLTAFCLAYLLLWVAPYCRLEGDKLVIPTLFLGSTVRLDATDEVYIGSSPSRPQRKAGRVAVVRLSNGSTYPILGIQYPLVGRAGRRIADEAVEKLNIAITEAKRRADPAEGQRDSKSF